MNMKNLATVFFLAASSVPCIATPAHAGCSGLNCLNPVEVIKNPVEVIKQGKQGVEQAGSEFDRRITRPGVDAMKSDTNISCKATSFLNAGYSANKRLYELARSKQLINSKSECHDLANQHSAIARKVCAAIGEGPWCTLGSLATKKEGHCICDGMAFAPQPSEPSRASTGGYYYPPPYGNRTPARPEQVPLDDYREKQRREDEAKWRADWLQREEQRRADQLQREEQRRADRLQREAQEREDRLQREEQKRADRLQRDEQKVQIIEKGVGVASELLSRLFNRQPREEAQQTSPTRDTQSQSLGTVQPSGYGQQGQYPQPAMNAPQVIYVQPPGYVPSPGYVQPPGYGQPGQYAQLPKNAPQVVYVQPPGYVPSPGYVQPPGYGQPGQYPQPAMNAPQVVYAQPPGPSPGYVQSPVYGHPRESTQPPVNTPQAVYGQPPGYVSPPGNVQPPGYEQRGQSAQPPTSDYIQANVQETSYNNVKASPESEIVARFGLTIDPACSLSSLIIRLPNTQTLCAFPRPPYGPGRYIYNGMSLLPVK